MITKKDYLRFFGIDDFIYENKKELSDQYLFKCVVIEKNIIKDSFFDKGESYNLLEKMLNAINLQITEAMILQANDVTLPIFVEKYKNYAVLAMGNFAKLKAENVYYTYHPQEIINKPSLKRDAWETLKKLKKCLK